MSDQIFFPDKNFAYWKLFMRAKYLNGPQYVQVNHFYLKIKINPFQCYCKQTKMHIKRKKLK